MATTNAKRPLTQLNHAIEQAEAEADRLEAERKVIAKEVARAARRRRFLRAAQLARRPMATFELWAVALLVVGSAVVGVLAFIATHLLFGSFLLALLMFLVAAVAGAMGIWGLLYRPADTMLPSAIAETDATLKLARARLVEKNKRIAEVNGRRERLIAERRDQIASGKLQRAALLQREWKSMRDAEWEDFIVEVFRTQGATVDRAGRVDSQDANLIVDFGNRRVAVFTYGEGHHVSSATIQQAVAAKERHRCDSCAVIINRRFTGAAQDFAKRQDCAAIGTIEFPDFVLGKIAF